jgi:hypothetical protein
MCSNDEKTDMILINRESNKNASAWRLYADNKHFPKTLRFVTNIHVSFANVLWVAFSIPSGSLSLVK